MDSGKVVMNKPLALKKHDVMRVDWREFGILPFLVSMPFMYFPKVLAGDTQPWIFATALIALLTFRPNQFVYRRDLILITLSIFIVFIYAVRSDDSYGIIRTAYTYFSFIVFWLVCQRAPQEYLVAAVKYTVTVWFVVGLYQFISIRLGFDIDIPGRFLAGRMGPPSLTAEASYYGSVSMLHLMYLLSDKTKKNGVYVLFAISSVLLSGSLLAMVLLVFPLLKLPRKALFMIVLALPVLLLIDYQYSASGVVSRLVNIFSSGFSMTGVLSDASLNLRAGHVYFTLMAHLMTSLLYVGKINFQIEYNMFAQQSGLLIETGANYILPAIGEMIYGGGIAALVLLLIFFKRIYETHEVKWDGFIKVMFVFACMLNPISLSNVFLIIYAQNRVYRK